MRILRGVKSGHKERLRFCCKGSGTMAAFPLLFLVLSICLSAAAADLPVAPQTTLVFFSDRTMQPDQWADLHGALQRELSSGNPELAGLDRNVRFVDGDRSLLGVSVDAAITVYLHGNCTLAPMEHRTAFAVPLGWVRRIDGEIQPFVHVDCTRIGEVIGEQARWLSRPSRDRAMAKAMAEVILHEWIHIATQSSHHAEKGVAKAQFGVSDLMGDSRAALAPRGGGK